MTITSDIIIKTAALLTAAAGIGTAIYKLVHWIDEQKKQTKEIGRLKEEQTLLTYGVLACLKGLKEQGCNGPVTEAIGKIERHLNLQAHM